MTYLKKTNPEWQPREHPGIKVGDVVDFPGPYQRLVEEGSAVLCDKDGNEESAYDTLGIMTDREIEAFRAWREMEKQKAIREKLEKEIGDVKQALATANADLAKPAEAPAPTPVQAETVEDAKVELEEKKKAWAAKMAAARAAKAAERAAGTEANA